MIDVNPHNTPLLAGADVHLVKNTEQASLAEIKHYQSIIGSLLYVLAIIQTSPLLYHGWPSMQQIPLKIIYALPNMCRTRLGVAVLLPCSSGQLCILCTGDQV